MVKCQHDGCTKGASFGIDDALRCAAHRLPSDIYIKQKVLPTTQQHVPRGLNYNPVGTTTPTTVHHIRRKGEEVCQEVECTKDASYGFPGESARWCAKHKKSAAVFLRRTAATMSAVKAKAEHVPSGLVHHPSLEADPSKVVHRGESREHCQHTGCHKAPSYGFPGEQGGYCYSHKTPSMTYLKHEKNLEKDAQQHVPTGLDIDHRHVMKHNHPDPPNEIDIASPLPDVNAAQRAVCEAVKNNEDPTFLFKVMSNILKHPTDFKYRRLRVRQPKFFTEVWLCPGLRAFCHSLGFVNSKDGAWVALHPVTPESLSIMHDQLVNLALKTNHSSLVGVLLPGWNVSQEPSLGVIDYPPDPLMLPRVPMPQ